MIAALYVDPRGCYSGVPWVEPWGLPERDARDYKGRLPRRAASMAATARPAAPRRPPG